MSILHVKAKQRDRHTLALHREPVFSGSFTAAAGPGGGRSQGCAAALLFRSLQIDSSSISSSSPSRSPSTTSSPAISQHEFSPISSTSSFASASASTLPSSQPLGALKPSSAGASSNLYLVSHSDDHCPSTRLDASILTSALMASKTLDERSSDTRDDTETRDSAISGLSILSDDTDHFYQRSIEHLRDRQRLRDAATNPTAFGRARRTKLSMDGLDRDKAASDSSVAEGHDARPTRSQSVTHGLERRQNIPKDWGRKGRQSSDFLRRINSTGDMDELRANDTEAEAALGVLPEQDSPLSSKKRHSRIPGPRVKRSIDDLMDRERREQEFSLDRDSSPARSPDASSTQEIEKVKDRGVASSRLADAAKRSLRMPGSLASAFRRAEQPVGQTMDSILGQLNPSNEAGLRKLGLDHNKSSGTVALSQNDATAAEDQPRNRHSDSRDLLRRFARASTASPSPSPARDVSATSAADQRAVILPTPDQTPPKRSNSLRQGVRGALNDEGPPSLRSSPPISKVPTRSSSLRSLKSPPRNPSKRLSQANSSELRTSGDDIPIPSIETNSPINPVSHRRSLPPVQEPQLTEGEHPDPLRSHPVTPEPPPHPVLGGLIKNVGSLIGTEEPSTSSEAEAQGLVRGAQNKNPAGRRSGEHSEAPLETLEKEVELDERMSGAKGSSDDTQQQLQLRLKEQDGFNKVQQSVSQGRTLDKRKTLSSKQGTTMLIMGECPNCHTQVSTAMPTLWDVSVASLKPAGQSIADALMQPNQAGLMRPTRLSYCLMAMLTWLLVEISLCRIYCPHYCTFWFPSYTDMQIKSPRFPFVLPWKCLLEPTEQLWRGPWQVMLGAIEPRGWGLVKRTAWQLCKVVRVDWLFGPGDERLEGIWDWPWWWTYLFGAAYGADWRCVGCVSPGA